MSENQSPIIQRHNTTDLVKNKIASFSQLNPEIKQGENSAEKRDKAFRDELEKIINSSQVTEFTDGKTGKWRIFQIVGDDDKKIPILVRVYAEEYQKYNDQVEESHRKYVEILGSEFVEDMTRVTISNKEILRKFSDDNNLVEGFVQDLRGLNKKDSLYNYLLVNDFKSIPSELRNKLKVFFEKSLNAFLQGYSLDFGLFPSPETYKNNIERANVLIDEEGVTFIDSETIRRIKDDRLEVWKSSFYSLKKACLLFAGKMKSEDAIKYSSQERELVNQVSVNTLNSEIRQLKSVLEQIS